MTATADTPATSSGPAVDLAGALALVDRAAEAPRRVLAEALPALESDDGAVAPEARSVMHRAVALSLRVLDEPAEAARHARLALGIARRAGLDDRAAEATLTLALCLFQCGQTTAALNEIERAGASAPADLRPQLLAQHGILLERLGRFDEAVTQYGEALAADPAPRDRARILNNRAIALAYQGRFASATADLDAGLAHAAGAPMLAAELTHNFGFVLALAGDLPAALTRFDEADEQFAVLGAPIGLNLIGRARALLRANLSGEARQAAAAAVTQLSGGRAGADAAEARVLLAIAALAEGDTDAAIAAAERARRALRRQGRPALAAVADHVVVKARYQRGQCTRRTLAAATRCADLLASVGLVGDELDARLTAALVARHLGDTVEARRHLDAVRGRRHDGPLVERTRAWHAEAVYQLDAGHHAAASAAARLGLDTVAELQSLMGATELQVGVAGHGLQLADVGLRVAVERDDPWGALAFVDRGRATALGLTATPSSDDGALAERLRALRAATVLAQMAPVDDDDPERVRRRVTGLEAEVRQHARHVAGPGQGAGIFRRAALVEALGPATLVTYVEIDGRLAAVTVTDGHARLSTDLGLDAARAADLVASALFALRRLARMNAPPGSRRAAADTLRTTLARLDTGLLAPLMGGGGRRPPAVDVERPLVFCPTGALHALSWSALPSTRGRPVAVVPTPRLVRRPLHPRPVGPAVLAAGPGLPGALAELDLLRAAYPAATVFGPGDALVDPVVAALSGASVAHLACHGRFRADNPMFSALDLTDGPLTVFDVEQLERAPAVVVLGACDVGTSAVSAGDELVGLASALLRAGTDSVIASLVPVPDEFVVGFMGDVHRALVGGASPARALIAARRALDPADPRSLALQASFVCFGAA